MVAILKGIDGHFIWQRFAYRREANNFIKEEVDRYVKFYPEKTIEINIVTNSEATKMYPDYSTYYSKRNIGAKIKEHYEKTQLTSTHISI